MSALKEVLARAEQFEAGRAAEVVRLTDSQQRIKAAVDEAKHDHRKAHGLVVRIRGVIEAVERLPEAAEILGDDPAPAAAESVLDGLGLRAGQDGEPPLVEVEHSGPIVGAFAGLPFSPALDYPDSHPVDPPQREPNVRPIAAAAAIAAIVSPQIVQEPEESARPARANGTKVQALGDEILAMFRKVQHGSTASLEMDAIFKETGKSASQVSIALTSLAQRGLIRRVKQAERGHVTVLMEDATA